MPLTLKDRIGMWLRHSRVKPLKQALQLAEAEGISTSVAQLEAHQLAGGDPMRLVESTILAKRNGIPAEFSTLSAFDLAGKNTLEVVKACLERKQYGFDTFSPETEEKIVGWTRDGTEVSARCTLAYRPPIQHAFGWSPQLIQERLGARISVYINTAQDIRSLELSKVQHEAKLLVLAKNITETIEKVQVHYQRGKYA